MPFLFYQLPCNANVGWARSAPRAKGFGKRPWTRRACRETARGAAPRNDKNDNSMDNNMMILTIQGSP